MVLDLGGRDRVVLELDGADGTARQQVLADAGRSEDGYDQRRRRDCGVELRARVLAVLAFLQG
jgi:hypothetical protein